MRCSQESWRLAARMALTIGLLLAVGRPGAAQRPSVPERTPAGRPVSSAAGRAVNGALKTALADMNARNALQAEVLKGLRARRPLAIVDGYWVSLVDLKTAYEAGPVRARLLAALGPSGMQLITEAGVSADRFVLVFTPARFGQIVIPDFSRDLTASLGVKAFTNHVTGVGPLVVAIVLGATGTFVLGMVVDLAWNIWERAAMAYNDYVTATGPNQDYDGDKIPNKDDPDDDDDKVPDDEDNYPYDPLRSICDCGRPATSLLKTNTLEVLPAFLSALRTAVASKTNVISLGAIGGGQLRFTLAF